MNQSKSAWIAAFALLVGCNSPQRPDGSLDSQTHWLMACSAAADCGSALACMCGACVRPCEPSGGCKVVGRTTSCRGFDTPQAQAFCGGNAPAALCLESCDQSCASGQRCEAGVCVASTPRAAEPPTAAMPVTPDAGDAAQHSGSAGAATASDAPTVGTGHGDVGAVAAMSASGGSAADSVSDADAGAALPDAGSHDSASACEVCRNASCRNYQGHDLVAGCLERIERSYATDPNDPKFIADCTAVLNCIRDTRCSNPGGLTHCYCGSANGIDCVGTAPSGSCVMQINQATRGGSGPLNVQAQSTDLGYPLGWATALIECEDKLCSLECNLPAATP